MHTSPETSVKEQFNAYYRKYAPLLLQRCMQYVKERPAAEDITHAVFVKALDRWDSFREEASPYTWLYRIATNLCLNHLRDHRREFFTDSGQLEAHIDAHGDGELEPPLRKVIVHELLSGFCTVTRRIVFLASFERLSQKEIAEVLGVSRNTVQKKWNRFLVKARRRCTEEL